MLTDARKKAFSLIIFFGLVSLLGDIIYEGARSVNGPYLKTLGANAALVGLIAGLGEFIGYGIRFISGYFSDKTRAYWLFAFLGYGMLIAVPLMALACLENWLRTKLQFLHSISRCMPTAERQ